MIKRRDGNSEMCRRRSGKCVKFKLTKNALAVRDYIIGVTTAHVKVIAHQRPAWKLMGILNEKWEPVDCRPKKYVHHKNYHEIL